MQNLILLTLWLSTLPAFADPLLSSWFTGDSTRYARVQASTNTSPVGTVTWTGQTSPVYAGIQEVAYTTNYVYVRSYGMAGYVMGPWYLDAAKTQPFPNWPAARSNVWRFARSTPVVATNTLTTLGAVGIYVNGVSLFDNRDGYAYSGGSENGAGNGYWQRDAYVNEGVTFDSGYAHQEQSGNYHYHAYSPAFRYQIGDNVILSNGAYVEASAPFKHSPILAWVADGIPVYGPYGYSNALNSASGVRRMISGYVARNGQFGTDNISTNGAARSTIPAWAQRAYGVGANQAGPTVSTNYPAGRYLEDKAYLGDLGYTQGVDFDLNEWNVRWCVTPEFPGGTWAYFITLTSSNTPAFPYVLGRKFFGAVTATSTNLIPAGTTSHFKGGPDTVETMRSIHVATGNVTLVWNSLEGGNYTIQASPDLTNSNNWTNLATNFPANAGTTTPVIETGVTALTRFYRVARTSLAAYWPATGGGGGGTSAGITSISPTSGTRPNTVAMTITLDTAYTPPPPPNNVPPLDARLTGPQTITGTSVTRNAGTGVVTANFNLNGVALGTYNVVVRFTTPMNTTNSFSYLAGFTVN